MSLGLLSPPSYTNSLLRVLLPPLCVFLKIAFIAPDCFNNSHESFKAQWMIVRTFSLRGAREIIEVFHVF